MVERGMIGTLVRLACERGERLTRLLRIRLSGMALHFASVEGHGEHMSRGLPKPFADHLCVTLLHMNDFDVICYAATCVTRIAVAHHRRHIAELGGIDILVQHL